MFHFCNLAKALSDENRIRILMGLRHSPLCVCQCTTFLDLAPSTTSKHLSILRQCQLIEAVKKGRWTYYQLPTEPANQNIAKALQWVQECTQNTKMIKQDNERLLVCLHSNDEEHIQVEENHSFCIHDVENKLQQKTIED